MSGVRYLEEHQDLQAVNSAKGNKPKKVKPTRGRFTSSRFQNVVYFSIFAGSFPNGAFDIDVILLLVAIFPEFPRRLLSPRHKGMRRPLQLYATLAQCGRQATFFLTHYPTARHPNLIFDHKSGPARVSTQFAAHRIDSVLLGGSAGRQRLRSIGPAAKLAPRTTEVPQTMSLLTTC